MNSQQPQLRTQADGADPFDLADDAAYRQWRERKLSFPASADAPLAIGDPTDLDETTRSLIRERLSRHNLLWYRTAAGTVLDQSGLRRLGAQLGLNRLDANLHASDAGVSAIQVRQEGFAGEFIPYTSRAINWHTDGYYNPPQCRVRAFILHCVRPAERGGENRLLDHERVYIALRDGYPDYLRALMADDVFAIPPLHIDGVERRGWSSGPVFCTDPETGQLHMRYSARLRHVRWADDGQTRAAVACLRDLIDSDPAVLTLRLQAGEGLISNNALHARTAFEDSDEPRLLLRARYHDRVAGTDSTRSTGAASRPPGRTRC